MIRAAIDGLVLGLSVAIFAGSAAILVLETAASVGRGRGLSGGAGVATGDGLWAVAFVALGSVAGGLRDHWAGLWKWCAVAALLLIGVSLIRSQFRARPRPVYVPVAGSETAGALYRSFLGHSVIDPVTAIFFISLLAGPDSGHRPAAAAALVVGVFCGSMCWQAGLVLIGTRRAASLTTVARRRLRWVDCILLAVFTAYIAFGT